MGEMKYLELHGDRVAYQDVGSGRSVVADPRNGGKFRDVAGGNPPAVERKYRVVAPDLIGHGQSGKAAG